MQGEIWTDGAFVPAPEMTRYTYTEGDKVYHSLDTGFVLLYDFGAQPGDTIYSAVDGAFPFENNCYGPPGMHVDFSYVIDCLGTQAIDGIRLCTQYIHNPNEVPGFWGIPGEGQIAPIIERIGVHPSGTWFGGGNYCVQKGWYAGIRCYSDSEIFVKGNTTGIACDSVVATYTPLLPGFSISPNPFMEELKLVVPAHSYPDLQFALYHYSGQEISRSALRQGDNILHTGTLPAGVYFWEIRSGARLLGNGKLVH